LIPYGPPQRVGEGDPNHPSSLSVEAVPLPNMPPPAPKDGDDDDASSKSPALGGID